MDLLEWVQETKEMLCGLEHLSYEHRENCGCLVWRREGSGETLEPLQELLLVQQLIHALLHYLTDPSHAKKVPSTPLMRLQVLPYVASFGLCTCRMS